MKRRSNRRWRRATALALAACIGAGLLVPGALAAEGDEAILIEGDPVPTEDSAYRASTYVIPQPGTASAYEGLSGQEALALAAETRATLVDYFPVTLFNYDADTINDAQHSADLAAWIEQGNAPQALKTWNALYFNDGNPGYESGDYTYEAGEPGYIPVTALPTYAGIANGNYYIQRENGTFAPVTVTTEGSTAYESFQVGNWSEDFPNNYDGTVYYRDDEGAVYRVTRTQVTGWRDGDYILWGEPADIELPTGYSAAGVQEVQSGVGISVADIPMTSVDMDEPETPEESAPAEPETPEESAPTEPEIPEESAPAEPETPEESAPAEPETPEESAPAEPEIPAGDPGLSEPPAANGEEGVPLVDGEVELHRDDYYYGIFSSKSASLDGLTFYHATTETIYTLKADDVEFDRHTGDGTYVGSKTLYVHSNGTDAGSVYLRNTLYAAHNYWTGNVGGDGTVEHKSDGTAVRTDNGAYIYGGLVQSELDSNGDIVFTVPDSGIFDADDDSTKDVYTNVGLPFRYNTEDGYYTFDSNEFGAYFENGRAQSNVNLVYSTQRQEVDNGGWKGAFLPFNGCSGHVAEQETVDFHFGMRADVEFTMTPDGMLNENTPITFNFSGDDDVWVFVDGQLILDLGGIHDRVEGTIDFSTGTVTAPENSFGTSGSESNVYTALGYTNAADFAAAGEHTLTIFYLERGRGESNCRIYFNLPQQDRLSVTKRISETDSEDQSIDQDTMEALNDREFTFTLTDNGAPVAYALYALSGSDSTYRTDVNGQFTLKNGQTATFTNLVFSNEHTYVVTETAADGFETPTWQAVINAADSRTESGTGAATDPIVIDGSSQIAESITCTFTNTWTYVTNPTISVFPDQLVVDFGLPVEIDVLANDVTTFASGSTARIQIANQGTAVAYGTLTVTEDQKVRYTLNAPLDDVVTFTYQAQAVDPVDSTSSEWSEPTTVTIIPATSMYYEQDFGLEDGTTGTLVNYTTGAWNVGETSGYVQEWNRVGLTSANSPYGADVAYANDTEDSARSVASVDTSSSHAAFSYTFTGTGTAILARLTGDTGYMYVKVTDESGGVVKHYVYRDTQVTGNEIGNTTTLYNIPVYEATNLDYGTYKVEVIIAMKNAVAEGTTFYLDGIKIYDPMDPASENIGVAQNAYVLDNESDNKVVQIRDKLLVDYTDTDENNVLNWKDGEDGNDFVFLTDTKGELLTAEEYKTIGPKNELYLDAGQSVTFTVVSWDPSEAGRGHLYIGMKALTGSGSVQVGTRTIDLSNTIDRYYDVTDLYSTGGGQSRGSYTFTITAKGGPVALTNIKVTGSADNQITDGNVDTNG